MKNALKAEFKKLLTVRSTYFISLIFLALICFLAFYVAGIKNAPTELTSPLDLMRARLFLAGNLTELAGVVSVPCGLVSLLLLTHEYRYGTIVYTLSANTSRSKVLLSKIIAVFVFVFVFALFATAIGLALMRFGVAVSGHALPHQDINYVTSLGKSIFYSEGFALAGLLFAALIRNQIGALAALFIVPNPIEGILSLLLKKNAVYLPFTALQQVIQPPVINGVSAARDATNVGVISAPRGALVFLGYFVVAWAVAWYLFLHRDAT